MIESSQPDVWRDRTITTLCRTSKPLAIWDQTLYFGSRKKGNCIRAYDKAVQQGVAGPWFRCEFSSRDRDLCAVILEDLTNGLSVGKVTAGLLGQYLRFVPPGLKAKGNRPTCSWWSDFLKEGEGYELKRQGGGKDDEPRKAVSRFSVLRYLKDAAKQDPREVLAAIQELLPDLQLAIDFS
jgi:DNA relaxase NicK